VILLALVFALLAGPIMRIDLALRPDWATH